jgi:propanol-preferring alcohol dehydrogenase
LGHLAVQYAKASGFRVIATVIGTNHMEFAESLGADLAMDPMTMSTEQFLDRVREKTDGGVHGVLALAPCVGSIELAIQTLRPTGTAVLVALPSGSVSIPIYDLVSKGWHIVGSLVGTRADLKAAMGFSARGEVVCKTHVEPMSNYQEALKNLREGKYEGRVVFAEAPEGVA